MKGRGHTALKGRGYTVLMGRILAALRRWSRFIPGFRSRNESSMLIAATYYGISIFLLTQWWHWGLLLLGLPFLVFSAIALVTDGYRRPPAVLAVLGGALLCIGLGGALMAALPPQHSEPVALASMDTTGTTAARALPPTAIITSSSTPTPTKSAKPSGTPAAAPEPTPPDRTQWQFVASSGGKAFHRPDCYLAKRIKGENLVGFSSVASAEAAGYAPCKVCKPDEAGKTEQP